MRQIILAEPGHFIEEQAAPPQRSDTAALVRIHSIGVCGTDLHAFAGRQPFFTYPRILGHELGVEIVELPAGEHGLKVGDQCAVEPYLYCGDCHACRQGKTNCCECLQVLGVHCDGGMRPLINVPLRLLHKSDKLSLDQLALVETLGIGAQANRRADIKSGQDVLLHRREMTVLSSRNSAGLFPKIIDMIETGQIDTAPWITHRMSLAEVVSEFPHLREQPDLVKAVIEVSDADT